MHIRLSTLAENTASWTDLLGEWGLSILVETDDAVVLVDTGYSTVAAHNAGIMKAPLKRVNKILFSHGHMDHTGGLVSLLGLGCGAEKPVEVLAHPDAWAPKFWRLKNGGHEYVGIPFARKLAESLGASFHLTPKPVWITDRIVTSGEIPMTNDFEHIDANACVQTDDGYVDDELKDDQSLFIKSDKGLVIVAGCAHRGIVNTMAHAQKLTGCREIYAVIGGIHLFGASERRIRLTLEEIGRLDVQRIGVSHCTGPMAGAFLAHELGGRFFFNHAGTITKFDV